MKTLVIHPEDPSTEFLREIYANLNCTVIRQPVASRSALRDQIKDADRVIMLGHGTPAGLLNAGWPYQKWHSFIVGREEVQSTFGVMQINL